MATKVYGIPGKTTVEIKLPVGKAILPLLFEHGCLDRKAFKPATYITNKKVIQDIIENSKYFGKTIKLIKSYGNDQPAAPAAPKAAAPKAEPDEPKVFEDVTSYDQVIAILKGFGVKATQLRTPELVKKVCAARNISFPNYNFDE